ncbi:MAG: lysylphosphatidylglycerol synthase domain-containing protein [Pyrinomonadaceae bacterium]
MPNDEVLRQEAEVVETKAKAGKAVLKGHFIWIQVAIFAAGLGLLFFVLYKIGFDTVYATVNQIGWGFLLIILTNFSRHVIRSCCIYLAIPAEHRNVSFRNVLAARLAGDAMNMITFTGPLLAEATKAAMLRGKITFSRSAAAVIVDDIIYYISVALMMLSGVLLMVVNFGANGKVIRYALIGVTIGALVMLVGMFLVIKYNARPLSFVLDKLDVRSWLPTFVSSKKSHVYEIETNVYSVYSERPKLFYSLLGLGCLAHVTSVLEVFLALYLLGFGTSVVNAYIIESLTKVINAAFSFVPGTVGVYEGGQGIILKALGFTTAIGVALALVRRGAILFWAAVGFAILLWRTVDSGTKNLTKAATEPVVDEV